MNTNNNQTGANDGFVERGTDSPRRKKGPNFNVQSGLQAGLQETNPYNDRARARRFAQGAANFLADFFS